VAVRPVGLTLRAADGAAPRGGRRGKNSEKLSPSVVVDGHAAPLTLLLGVWVELEVSYARGFFERHK